MSLLSIVVPCFNEEDVLEIFYEEIGKVSSCFDGMSVDMELVFVDDGSTDQTLTIIKSLCAKDKRVRFLSLSKNFGKEASIFAGLEYASGDYVVLIDADLQDPPALLPEMYRLVKEEGYDAVATRRTTRSGEPVVRSFFARQYYKLIKLISKTEFVDGARDFRLMTRQMADAILALKEYNRFTKGINEWIGFKTKWLEYENIQRAAGTTKWSFWSLFVYSLEGITAFSTVPLMLSAFLGIFLCAVAFFFIIFIIVRTLMFGDPVSGWPSLAVLILFIGGSQLFCMGILGQYLAKTYLETKRRPIYLVKETEQVSKPMELFSKSGQKTPLTRKIGS